MREIGGYLELDTYRLPMLHDGALALNCGRNALAYLILTKNIRKICLPWFLCSSVRQVCEKYGVQIRHYRIQADFSPEDLSLEDEEWLYVVNAYGQLSSACLQQLVGQYVRVIVDNAQNYFAAPLPGVDTLYSCRKYFGVADGAFLYTDARLEKPLPRDESFERMHFVLGRYERTASEFYAESAANNRFFAQEPIREMSRLTENLLHAIDYAAVKARRTENAALLARQLQDVNRLEVVPVEGAFMYPLLLEDAQPIRQRLQEQKIYIPTLWPNVPEDVPQHWREWDYARNILPLPCDQRYGAEQMQDMIAEVYKCID